MPNLKAKALKGSAGASASFDGINLDANTFNLSNFEMYKSKNPTAFETDLFQFRQKKNAEICAQNYEITGKKSWKTKANKYEYASHFERWTVDKVATSKEQYLQMTVTHEYGHVIADQYIGQINGWMALGYSDQAMNDAEPLRKLIEATYRKAKKDETFFKWGSAYGGTDKYEFFAETFTSYVWEREKLPEYAIKMIEEVVEYGKKTM